MKNEIRYIELKSGYADNGPAWIGKVKLSKSGNTVYFNNKAFRRCQGISGNFYDVETLEEYWISAVKKDGADRHWAGHGKVLLGSNIVMDYLELTGQKTVDKSRFEIVDIPEEYPIDRIYKLENRTVTKKDMEEALQAIASMISRSEEAQGKLAQGTSQHTLLKNRIKALRIASSLITNELAGHDTTEYTIEELKEAFKPIVSLISKSEKARMKLLQGTWQHTMLCDNLKALYIASPLITRAFGEN